LAEIGCAQLGPTHNETVRPTRNTAKDDVGHKKDDDQMTKFST